MFMLRDGVIIFSLDLVSDLFIGRHLILFFSQKFIKKFNDNTDCKSGRGVQYVSPVLSVCQYGWSGPRTARLLGV